MTDVGDTDTGFFVDSSGNVLIKQGGANSNYLQFRSGALVIETTNFSIDSNGDVSVTGTITASGGSFTGNVTAGGVTIGTGGITGTGYTINTGGIVMSGGSINLGNLDAITDTADTDTGFMVDSSGNVLIKQGGANSNFIQFNGGNLAIKTTNFEIASNGNVTVTGAITATSGTFTGAINASGGTFTGHVTAGGAKFGVDVEGTNDGIYLTADNHWYDSGTLTCNDIAATGGAIGGFTLASSTLSSTNLLLDSTNQKLVFRDASNDYLTFVTETNSFSKTGDSSDAANVTTAYIKQLTGTDLVILHGDADRITFVGPGRFRAAYTHTSANASLDDAIQEGAIEGRTANYRGNLSSTIGSDNINAGVLGVNNRGGSGGLKVGIYGRCNDHWTSVAILGEGKYRDDYKSSSWSGVFRHRPFVVGDPFEASNGVAGYNDGDLDEWSDKPDDEYAALMVFPYNARSDDTTTDARRGRVGIRKWLPDYELDVTGTIRATGNVIAYSDERKKENVVRIENGLSLVEQLRGVRFDWKEGFQQETNTDKGKRQIGVIAQEVEKVLPEVVSEDAQGFKSVNYPTLTAVLIESVKDLKQIIDNQQKQIDELKKVIGVKNGNK